MLIRAAGLARLGLRLGLGLGLGLAASRARAATPDAARIHVAAPGCAAASLVRSLQIELAALGPDCCTVDESPAASPPGAIGLTLDPCDPGADQIAIAVSDPARGGALRRELPLGDVSPPARPRALALAVAELIRTLLAARDQPASTSPPPPAATPGPPPPSDDRPRLGADAAADLELSAYPQRDTQMWGGRLTGAIRAAHWFAALHLSGAAGSASFPLGTVAVRTVGGGLSAGPRFALGRLTLALGAGGAIGWGWVSGTSSQPGIETGSGGALVATLGARAALTVPVAPHLGLRALVEGGTVVRGLDAHVEGSAPAGLGGPYVIVGIGVGWSQ